MSKEIINQALALIKQKELDAARTLLKPVIQSEPGNEAAWLALAETYDNEENKRQVYEHCLAHIPHGEHVKKALARMDANRSKTETKPGETTLQEGGIGINGGDIRLKNGSIIGRDQINQTIQFIINTGQVLSMAQEIEGLLPKESSRIEFSNIHDALQSLISEHDNNYLIEATIRAGEILAPVIKIIKVDPGVNSVPAPLGVLYEIEEPLGEKLTDLKYWRDYSEPFTQKEFISIPPSGLSYFTNMKVIWLWSTKEIWRRYLKEQYLFGFLKYQDDRHREHYVFIGKKSDAPKPSTLLQHLKTTLKPSDGEKDGKFDFTNFINSNYRNPNFHGSLFKKFTFKQRRLFLFGLTMDLIRLSAQVIKDMHEDRQLSSNLGNIPSILKKDGGSHVNEEHKD